jgi:pimeloyl-ACP methyl ester carboxylesterase
MQHQTIDADGFHLAVWMRLQPKTTVLPVYIEGDGLAFVSTTEISPDPTPVDPLALRLAVEDHRPSIVYIARPCQFAVDDLGHVCRADLWTSGRYGETVVSAMNHALDQIKALAGAHGFELIGYSGGGTVAALLAARRSDVVGLRTVAGNLDPAGWTVLHDLSPLSNSLDPMTIAPQLARLPQRHYAGGNDAVVPPGLMAHFMSAIGHRDCVAETVVPNMTHDGDWPILWPRLVEQPLACAASVAGAKS